MRFSNLHRLLSVTFCSFLLVLLIASGVFAQSLAQDDQNSIYGDTVWYKAGGTSLSCNLSLGSISGTSNLDYAGRAILNQGQLQALQKNTPTYQQAAQQVGIPWQVLAAVHYRETDFSTNGSDGGPNGQYQITSKNYPYTGQLTQQEFLQESIDAASYIKSDGAGLGSNPTTNTVKDAFGRYNGLPALYAQQAGYLGYNPSNQAYEGSPYVMNMADAARDPHIASVVSSGHWDQYVTPTLVVPVSIDFYGAYVVYASLAGITLNGGSCVSSANCNGPNNATAGLNQAQQNIVCIANQELKKWSSGQIKPGTGYYPYSENRPENWCADFASWVYNQAGVSLGPAGSPTNNWNVSYVPNLYIPPQNPAKFNYHSVTGYRPEPGDLALHGGHHVNIVVAISGSTMTLVGGNQGSNDISQSVVSSYQTDFTDGGDITGFLSPK